MATGTVTTQPSYDWTVRHDSFSPDPTIIGDTIRINAAFNSSFPTLPPFVGFVWCHVDSVSGIPAGATITQIDVTLNVVQSSATSASPPTPQSPSVAFATESEILAGGNPVGFGGVGAGGPGDLPADTSPHEVFYDGATYPSQSGGGGIQDPQGFVDAIDASDPLGVLVTAQIIADGEYLEYDTPWTFTIHWSTPSTSTMVPPLRQWPREDGLGASSAPRVYPPPKSIQRSNRRAGGYL